MNLWEVVAIAIGVSMDCLAVSVTGGIIIKRIIWRIILKTAFLFGFFQMLMTDLGWLLARGFRQMLQDIDHWIAFALLLLLGCRMIYESFSKKEDDTPNHGYPNNKTLLLLAVATSIDALAVGASFAFQPQYNFGNMLAASGIIGIASLAFAFAGFLGGIYCGKIEKLKTDIIGGLILIAIGAKILIEHLTNNI